VPPTASSRSRRNWVTSSRAGSHQCLRNTAVTVEATRLLKPLVQRVAKATRRGWRVLQTTTWLPAKCQFFNHLTFLGRRLQLLANNIPLVPPLPLAYISLPMLSEFFKSRTRIQTLRDGPAGSLFESFAQALSETGYATLTARKHLRAAEHFIYWTHRHGMPVCKLNEQSLARFERHLSRCRRPHYGHADQLRSVHGARLFLTHLRDVRIISLPSLEPPVHDPALLSAFSRCVCTDRAAAERIRRKAAEVQRSLCLRS